MNRNAYMREWNRKNRERVNARRRERRLARLDAARTLARAYKERHRERLNAEARAWHARNPGKAAEYARRQKAKNPEKYQAEVNRAVKAFERRLRLEVLCKYSRGAMACACCGTTYEPHLTIDHVHMDGAEERRRLKAAGMAGRFYVTLKARGWPEGYRVLCFNCNRDAWNNRGECGCREAFTTATGTGAF